MLPAVSYLFLIFISKGLGGDDIVIGASSLAVHHLTHEAGSGRYISAAAVHARCKLCQHGELLPGLHPQTI